MVRSSTCITARLITLPPVTSDVLSVISSVCLQIATNDIAH